jgi:GxxExxY protein
MIPIHYKGVYVGFERADIVIYDKMGNIEYILELKSQNSRLASKEIMQLRKYLKNTGCPNGLLINFYETLEIIKVDQESSQKINCS